MIEAIVLQWERNKHKLESWFRENKHPSYKSYDEILKKIFELVITDRKYDTDRMTVIDNGEYSGDLIFIIPEDTYNPTIEEHLLTWTGYGSCSGCDAILSISQYEEGLPNEEQVQEYMTLALHLIQRMKALP